MPSPSPFALLIRSARARLGLDLEAAAGISGCSESYISLIETGKRLPSEEVAVRLARALGIDPTEAVLALVRARLPEAERKALDPTALVREAAVRLAVVREVLGSQLRARADAIRYALRIDAEGGAESTIRVEGLRPVPGRAALKEVTLHDALATGPVKPRILEAPSGLHFEIETEPAEEGSRHVLVFPEGWSADDAPRPLSFEFHSTRPRAYGRDLQSTLAGRSRSLRNHAARWSFPAFTPVLLDTLTLSVQFVEGQVPPDIAARAWLGPGPLLSAPDNLIEQSSSRRHQLRRHDSAAELLLDEPLPLYTFALVWTPLDRSDRLDASRASAR